MIDALSRKKTARQLSLAVVGAFAALTCLVLFNNLLFPGLPLGARIPLSIITQWVLLLAPGLIMLKNKERLSAIGLSFRGPLGKEIFSGLLIALAFSCVFTLLPILLGLRDFVGTAYYTKGWQFAYQFVYMIFGVALAEEVLFRGYIFHKLLQIKNSRLFAILISSLLFGLFHIFSFSLLQIFSTTLLGILFCLCREKFPHCSLISLVLAHGVYNALISLWLALL